MKAVFIFAGALLLGSGCSQTQAQRTVDWYKQHDAERRAQIASCARDGLPEALGCTNARKAQTALDGARRGYVDLKPVDFGKEN